jgi:hypothetical protein
VAKTYDFKCEEVTEFGSCGFESTGWKSESLRDARGEEHLEEHETGEPMREIHEFREAFGVEV